MSAIRYSEQEGGLNVVIDSVLENPQQFGKGAPFPAAMHDVRIFMPLLTAGCQQGGLIVAACKQQATKRSQ
jgi:hypothetical protein